MSFDFNQIRKEFPFFSNNKNLIYFDNAATTQKPKCVLEKYIDFYSNFNSNVHRGVYKIAERATEEFESTRECIADFISSKSKESIIFTRGATESINLVAHGWAANNLNEGDHILLTEMEHHSNIVPWQMIAERKNITIDFIKVDNNGLLNSDDIDRLITNNTKLISIVHQSNVLGTINPVKDIIRKAHSHGAVVLIDGAQSIAHQEIDVQDLDCDFFVFSGHKIYGPTGVGVLYSKAERLNQITPVFGGGEMIDQVTKKSFTLNEAPWKLEAGTPPIAQVVALKEAIKFVASVGVDNIFKYESERIAYAQRQLLDIDKLELYSPLENKGPTLTFNFSEVHSYDFTKVLDQMNIAIRSGHHCAQPLLDSMNISSSNRASLAFYNSFDEVDKFIDAVKKSLSIL